MVENPRGGKEKTLEDVGLGRDAMRLAARVYGRSFWDFEYQEVEG
jgi:hypothetical protein